MHLYCFFRQTLLQSYFIECEILQSPIISYQSLLFIATAMSNSVCTEAHSSILTVLLLVIRLATQLCT